MAYNGFGSQLYQAGENSTAASALLGRTDANHQQGFKKASGFNKKPVCTYCGYTGHTQDKCYKQRGYPLEWKPRPRNQSVNQIHHQSTDGNMRFTQDDEKIHGVHTDQELWQWSFRMKKIAYNMYVSMPNGQQAAIGFTGSVYLSDSLILHNALYIPEFHYNLISVSSFIKNSNQIVKMHSDQCIIQDVPHGKMIGRAELKNGLYYLVFPILTYPANLPDKFWGECVLHAAYIINRLTSVAINNQVPYQILIKKISSYQHLRVFGCLAYATTVGPKSKLEARAKKCVFLGYAGGTKCYKVYDLASKELFISRDVAFHELVFPFQQSITPGVGSEIILPTMIPAPLEEHDVSQTQGQASR
ncbi:PREDICTED: uncharacterized protein LOC109184448 [Ipomoea nil]|uniref:uncharacterized protein LOC109184448 n=1 Tax=Ipomoea nil TaxID=35883 RepID=UPI000900CE95|nr:PREDICTED: uncharacterized protein LOC109184448 [Ipomoea nil]